jgi:hypothetical protein
MPALCLYVLCRGVPKIVMGVPKKKLLATSHPPDQKSETAPGRSNDSLPPTNPTPRSKLCKEVIKLKKGGVLELQFLRG